MSVQITNEHVRAWAKANPELWKQARRDVARRYMLPFTLVTYQGFEQSWHHNLCCDVLDLVLAGALKRVMVFEPPRHSKTELFQRRFPAFILGRQPNAKIIGTSYSAELASANCVDVQRIIESPEYEQLFPDTKLPKRGRGKRDSTTFELARGRGGYRSAGVGGPITGFGFNFGLIDDPLKNREEAESLTVTEKQYAWYTSTFYTRMDSVSAPIILSMTRWHPNDLAGKLLSLAKSDPTADQWTVISLPAILDQEQQRYAGDERQIGEALWPKRFPIDHLLKVKQNVGAYDWEALYQQRPYPAGGAKIPVTKFKVIEREQCPKELQWANFTDLAVSAKTSADFTVNGFIAYDWESGNVYLRDVIRGQWEWPQSRKLLTQRFINERYLGWHGPAGVEKAGQQQALIDDLNSIRELVALPLTFEACEVDKDKLTRALPWIAKVDAGKFYLVQGPWLNDFIAECSLFTGAGDLHDDQVDMVSGAYALAVKGAQGVGSFETGMSMYDRHLQETR